MLQNLSKIKTMAFYKQRWRIFANWLKKERENAHLSQDGLADLVGVDRQTIYRLENVLSGTKRETVIAIAAALKAEESVALNKAGFSTQNGEDTDSHDILEGVTVQFNRNSKITKKGQEKILDAVRLIVTGVKTEEEKKSELSSQDNN